MTHILKADRSPFLFSSLKDLSSLSPGSLSQDLPLRLLASLFCHVTREGMYKISNIAREDKLSSGATFRIDPQMENEFILEGNPAGEQLRLAVVSKDGMYLFIDCSELNKEAKVKFNHQYFFSGHLTVVEHEIVILKLQCITSAEGLDIELFKKTLLVMQTVFKKPQFALAPKQEPAQSKAMDIEVEGEEQEKKKESMDIEEIDSEPNEVVAV